MDYNKAMTLKPGDRLKHSSRWGSKKATIITVARVTDMSGWVNILDTNGGEWDNEEVELFERKS
jgi:hypothetical protein